MLFLEAPDQQRPQAMAYVAYMDNPPLHATTQLEQNYLKLSPLLLS